MAIDTRSKRAAIFGLGLVAALTLPLADATIDASDRQHVAFTYPIGAAAPIVTGQEPSPIVALCAPGDYVVRVPADDPAPDATLLDVAVRVSADDVVVLIGPDDEGIES